MLMKGLKMYKNFVRLFLILLTAVVLIANAKPLDINNVQLVHREDTPPQEDIKLFNTAQYGPGVFVWYKNIQPGFYTLEMEIETGLKRRDFIVSLDWDKIGVNSGYFTDTGKQQAPPYRYDFNITKPGIHIISIQRFPFLIWAPQEETLRITKLSVSKRSKPKVWDIYDYHHPGQSYHQLWGWMPSSTYQRPGNRKLTREYWDKRIIEEAAKWGSNYVQLYPYAFDGYVKEGSFKLAIAYAHKWGFLMDQHQSWLGKGDFEDYIKVRPAQVFSKLFDRTNTPWQNCMDGWESEDPHDRPLPELPLFGKKNVIESTNSTWQYHPGSFVSECWYLAATIRDHYENILHQGYHGPNYGKVQMCAGSPFKNGYDDIMALQPFPQFMAFKNDYNWVFRTCQADSRPYTNNKFGGISMTDWIVKQCWDFFRPNAYAVRQKKHPITCALNWLGEPSVNLPEAMRKDVYAASMDPCRGAMAYKLATTGRDGLQFWNYPRDLIAKFIDATGAKALTRYRQRYNEYLVREWYPAHTTRQHNGILAVNHHAMAGQKDLLWDTENLGQFDVDAKKLTLLKDIFKLQFDTEQKDVLARKFEARLIPVWQWPTELKPGLYQLQVEYNAKIPNMVEVYYGHYYIGAINMLGNGSASFPFYVSDENQQMIDFRLVAGYRHGDMDCKIVKLKNQIESKAKIGIPDNSSSELMVYSSEKEKIELRKAVDITKPNHDKITPAGLQAKRKTLPTAVDFWFDGKAGNYLLCLRAKSQTQSQRVDVTLNTHLFSERQVSQDDPEDENLNVFSKNNWYREYGMYGRIGALMLNAQWNTYQLPVVLVHDSGTRRFKIELSIPPGSEQVDFDYISLVKMPVDHDISQVGGHLSVVRENTKLLDNQTSVAENRKWTIAADQPSIFVTIDRDIKGDKPVKSTIDINGYEIIEFNGSKVSTGHTSDRIPNIISLKDQQNIYPPLTIRLENTESIGEIRLKQDSIEFAKLKTAPRPLYAVITLRETKTFDMPVYAPSVEKLKFNGDYAQLKNPFRQKTAILARVDDPQPGPYFVKEQKWWSVRGAQTVCTDPGAWDRYLIDYNNWLIDAQPGKMPAPPVNYDILRCIAEPGETVQIQRYGYINDIVRPGWGSQKQILISRVRPDRCTVKVLNVSPYMFAPRVQFKKSFDSVRLNGKVWDYHDGQNVFLPQETGNYSVEVADKGLPTPALTSTAAKVRSARFRKNIFKINIEKPDYVFKIPHNLRYKLGLSYDLEKFNIISVKGGKLLREGPLGGIVDCYGQEIIIEFGKGKKLPKPEPKIQVIEDGMIEGNLKTGVITSLDSTVHNSPVGDTRIDNVVRKTFIICEISALDQKNFKNAYLEFYVLAAARSGKPRRLSVYAVEDKEQPDITVDLWNAKTSLVTHLDDEVKNGTKKIDITEALSKDLKNGRKYSTFCISMDTDNDNIADSVSISQIDRMDDSVPKLIINDE